MINDELYCIIFLILAKKSMKLRYLLYFSLLIHLFSCQNAKMNSGNMEVKEVEFEEANQVNIKLIGSEFKILKSQNEINNIYKIINDNNPSPRKTPIPIFEENETYIVLQPKIERSDFVVEGISEINQSLQIAIHQYDNPEFKNKKYPAIIIKLNKKSNYDNVKIKK